MRPQETAMRDFAITLTYGAALFAAFFICASVLP
jgi:hypothetical protein